MAVSAVSICNVALAQLGANPINSFTEGTVPAILCNTLWDQSRQVLLQMHPWNFAVVRVELAQDVDAPVYQFTYSYTLPADCLRLLQVYEDGDYRLEGTKILTDKQDCFIKYVSDEDDPTLWSRGFVNTMTAYMRQQLSYAITKSAQEVQASSILFDRALRESKAIDASEDTGDAIGQFDNTLITSRF